MTRAQIGTLATLLVLPAITLAQQAIRIDDNVTWLPSAQSTDVSDLDYLDEITPPTEESEFDVLYRNTHYRLSGDTVRYTSTIVYRFNNDEAVRDYGTLRTTFDAARDTTTIARATIIDSSGSVHVVDPTTVQIVPDDTFNIFTDRRYVVLPMKGVDVGSIAIIEHEVTSDRSKEIAPWATVRYEQFGVPIGKTDLLIEWDSPDLAPQWDTQLEGMSCSESSENMLRCSVSDVPSYEIEDDVYYEDVTPQFVAAERMTWLELADWYKGVFDPAVTGHPSVAAKSAELAGDAEDEAEVLRRLHDFVSRQVRYVGLEHGDNAYRPHSSDTTLARLYGDCKDKSALLIDLLSHHGISMSPVLVSTSRKDPQNLHVPNARYFDHLIVCGELGNGDSYCLDATDPYTGIGHLSNWVQGAAALNIDNPSAPFSLPADNHRMAFRENLKMVLSESGDLQESGSIDYMTAYGSNIRGHLAGLSSEEIVDWARDDYHNTVSDSVNPDFKVTGIDDTDKDVTVAWSTVYEGMVDSTGDLDYAEASAWLNQAINYQTTENEHYDYRFGGISFESVVTFEVADRWNVALPSPDIDLQSRFGSYIRSIERKGNAITLTSQFDAPRKLVPASEIPDLNKFLNIVKRESRWGVAGTLSE